MVDVGVGYVKAGPDTCPICGYIEAGPDPHDLPIEHYRNCWKLGLDPHPKLPELRCRPLKTHLSGVDCPQRPRGRVRPL